MTALLCALAAFLLDGLLGEPRRFHPLVGFGWLAEKVEGRCRPPAPVSPVQERLSGLLGWLCLIVPPVALVTLLSALPDWRVWIEIGVLYGAIGHRSLHDHACPVARTLDAGALEQARVYAGRMVSRDTATLDPGVATTESVLENGNDAVFAALFWFIVAGAPGAILYRLANTLDAMWGYRNARYRYFGWAAARLDDGLNYIPARLTALTYALCGETRSALYCWYRQAPQWDSPNAGPVMAAGAGALQVELGGAACYQGEWHLRPLLGIAGRHPEGRHIEAALKLIRHGVMLWFCVWGTAIWLAGLR